MRRLALHLPVTVVLAAVSLVGCAQALPTRGTVGRIVDGDTIELTDGRLVRYIGIDAPELRRKDAAGRWVMDPAPFAQAATEENRRLVEGRELRLEYDVQTHDRYGRLLAYVYVGEVMVNEALIKAGFAHPLTIPPNVKYADRFRALAEDARRAHRGLWGLR